MSARLIVDTIFFFINLFKQVDDENIQETEDTLTYLNLEQFEMIEDIIHELHKDKDKNGLIKFRDVIKILQKRLQLFAKLKSQLFFIEAGDDSTPGRTQGTNTKEEWDDIRDRLKTFNLCKQVFHARSQPGEEDKDVEYVDIEMMSNLINELRLKINLILAGDYQVDDEDVVLANKLNEMNNMKKDPEMYAELQKQQFDDDQLKEFKRVEIILTQDFTLIKDKY